MCRNIKTLFNFEPPATEDEIRASALQFVRKLSGFTRPSQANAAAFDRAVDEVTAEKARARSRERFALNIPDCAGPDPGYHPQGQRGRCHDQSWEDGRWRD